MTDDDPATRDPAEDDRREMAQAIGEANGGAVGLGQLVNAFGAVGSARFDLGRAEQLTDEATVAVLNALADLARAHGWRGGRRDRLELVVAGERYGGVVEAPTGDPMQDARELLRCATEYVEAGMPR